MSTLGIGHPSVRDATRMAVYIHQDWLISVLPSEEEKWTFFVRSSPNGDLLSNNNSYRTPRTALTAARFYIDRLVLQVKILAVLDPLLESRKIDAKTYTHIVQLTAQILTLEPQYGDETG